MRVYRLEIRKLLRFPAIWFLLSVFLAFNGFLVRQSVGGKETAAELAMLHEIILRRGVNLSNWTEEASPQDFGQDEAGQLEAFYVSYAQSYRHKYDALDMREMQAVKEQATRFAATGKFQEFTDRNYDRWQKRVEEIRRTGEGLYAFYPGNVYRIHEKLYGRIFSALLIEGMILVSFCALYLMDLERISGADGLVYASREGRGILLKKLGAGLLPGVSFEVLLIIVTLVSFFHFVPMEGLWDVPMSSVLYYRSNLITDYPFVTVIPLTFAAYLAIAVLMTVFLATLLGTLCGAAQLFLKNSYVTALTQTILFLGMLALPFAYHRDTFGRTFLSMNPATLWYMAPRWLMENSLTLSFGGWEILTAVIWSVIALTGMILGNRYVRGMDC